MVSTIGQLLVEGAFDTLHRAQVDGRPAIARVTREHPPRWVTRRLEREWRLREVLDPAWALVPVALREDGARRVLLLEPFEGLPLRPVEPGDIRAGLQLLDAVSACLEGVHQSGLVHASLMPEHILVDASGAARLTAFGGASFLSERAPVHAIDEPVVGALPYIAPEQTGRTGWAVDERADLYALGVILYERLAGRHPFSADDALGWFHAHLARVPVPLSVAVPGIPEAVSALVARLLEKHPDLRYQSAHGLRADVTRCRVALERTGWIAPFPMGRHDLPGRLRVPALLVGRDAERGALRGAWSGVLREGGPALVTVSGYAGIGKTALVRELAEPVTLAGGLLVSGKFDAYKRDIPYATLAQAFDDVVRRILALPEDDLAVWRARLAEALGPNARLVTDLVPRLEILLGAQPPAPDLPLPEAERRTLLVLGRFVSACAPDDHPLALFLDDLQWADPASLRAIAHLFGAGEPSALLVVAAWRDNEVQPSHPWALTLEEIRRKGARTVDIVLGPLEAGEVRRLVATMLRDDEATVDPLARVVDQRTAGNPFFAIQMLVALRQDGLLQFDRPHGGWTWDDARLREVAYTENVVEMLEGALRRLAPEALHLTRLAACFGDHGDLDSLAAVHGRSAEETEAGLRGAVREGLILPRDERWRFLHDRVRQAAYQSLPERERERTHLRIGRRYLGHISGEALQGRIFEVATQFNLARGALTDPAERHRVAHLNLVAGRRAKASAAWQCGTAYLASGIELLGPDPWATDRDLAFALELERAQCEWLSGLLEDAERRLLALLTRTRDRDDKAAVYRALPSLQWMRGKFVESVRTAVEGLALFGVPLDPHPGADAARRELDVIATLLGDRPIEALADLPPMTDAEARTAMDMLVELYAPAYITDVHLMCLVSARMVSLSLRHGNGDASPMGYAALARALGPVFGRYDEGYRLGKVAWDLVERKGLVAWKGRVADLFGISSAFWVEPLRGGVAYSRLAFEAAMHVGDVAYACWACAHLCHYLIASGAPLEEVSREIVARLDFVRTAGFDEPATLLVGMKAFVDDLRGETQAFSSWTGGGIVEEDFLAGVERDRAPLTRVWHHTFRCAAHVLAAKAAEAVEAGERALPYLWTDDPRRSAGCVTQLAYAEFHPWFAFATTLRWTSATEEERVRLASYLSTCEARLRTWSVHAPDNFRHRHALLVAELARIDGRLPDAMQAYEEAVREASRQGLVHHEALACEVAAHFYLDRGATEPGRAYLRRAREAYARWGARGKVRQLDGRWPDLVPPEAAVGTPASPEDLDVLALVKAGQAIAREIDLQRVEEALLRVVMEQAGARRVFLLLAERDDVRVEAVADEGAATRSRMADPVSAWPSIDEALSRYVLRTGETVAIGDASQPAFHGGVGVRLRERPMSVICVPVLRKGRAVGALYAENDLAPGAFSPARIAVTEALAAQAAISLESATLYEQLRRMNEELEHRVADRTRDLEAANRELSAFTYSVSHDLRAPLRAIDGFGGVLERQLGEAIPVEARATLRRIRGSAKRMSSIVEDMLTLSSVTRADVRRERLDLGAVAREVLDGLRAAEPERNVEVHVAEGLLADADARLVRIALENLLGNAWKYSRRRDPARIEMGAVERDGARVFFVRDNGAGFDPAYADRLFQPFKRLHSDREFEGTGVGLATVHRIVLRHGGRIWGEAQVDQGATFYFTL